MLRDCWKPKCGEEVSRVLLTEGTLDVHWKHALACIASMEMVRERVLNGVGNIMEVGVPCTLS